MTRRRKRQIIAIVVLVLLLSLLTVLFVNYRATRSLGFKLDTGEPSAISTPEYLYSFAGPETDRLERPLGVLIVGNRVYVTDSRRSQIDVFTPEGSRVATFGAGELKTPLYMARNPKSGEIWTTDRRLRAIKKFTAAGKYVGEFDPKLPKDQLPDFDTKGLQWAPVALDFAPDGTLYVTELLNGHRLLIFAPDGSFKRSVGTAGIVTDPKVAPLAFQFPNGVKVVDEEVWVADSNNQRIQVFDLAGNFLRLLPVGGLPRGLTPLVQRSTVTTSPTPYVAVVDTLAHDVTIWDAEGTKADAFGELGVLEAQFSYPNDIDRTEDGTKLFIADTANGRIQVWGWPADAAPIPTPSTPTQWMFCFAPLLLLPLLLLTRRRKFFATADFVLVMFETNRVHLMPGSRRRWLIAAEDYERVSDLVQDDVDLGELLQVTEFSESDVRELMDRLELDRLSAIRLALGKRSRYMCAEDGETRRLAKVLEIDVLSAEEFEQKFAPRSK